jgi:riboflavin biosynthesis pyrimidine reductase
VTPLELLFERDGLPTYDLPDGLERLYGSGLGFPAPRLYANFVSSLDGVVALDGVPHSGRIVAEHSEADRFVMGLLRACADAVLIGAGTLRAAPGSRWTPADASPDDASEFAELRRRLGRVDEPRLVVLTARGEIDPAHPGLSSGALVLTTERGAASLGPRLPPSSTVVALGAEGPLDMADVLAAIRRDGHDVVLSEAGPQVTGGLLTAGLLDELFLTLSPTLAGRRAGDRRPGLVEGVDLLPSRSIVGELLGLRRDGSHLFLRYALR